LSGATYTLDSSLAGKIGGSTGANDNRLLRSDGTGGLTLQATGITTDDSDNVSGVATLSATTLNPTNALAINKGGTANTTAAAAFDALAPTTTRGDLTVRGAASNGRLALGTNGYRLTSNGTDVVWAPDTAGIVLLNSGTVTNQATLDIVLSSYTSYRGLQFVLSDMLPATDATELWMRFSTDGGSTYDATGYNYCYRVLTDAPSGSDVGSGSANQIVLATAIGNGATEGICQQVWLPNQTSAARWARIVQSNYYITSSATPAGGYTSGGGAREAAQDTDAVRFLFSAGNIASGAWAVYGLT
jgi:hypothetical protein